VNRHSFLGIVICNTALALLAECALPSTVVTEDTHHLRLLLRDASTQQFTAARVRVNGDLSSPLLLPDSSLLTRYSQQLGPYVFVADSLHLDLPTDGYAIDAVRGTESLTSSIFLTLDRDTTLTLELNDWIEARDWGWWSGDPHVHSDHAQGAFYPRPSLQQVAAAARAEGLDLLYLLDNDVANPGGPAILQPNETAVFWGEEFRSDFWGHIVLLGLDDLLIGRGYPGCCGLLTPAWPTLAGWIDTGVFPYVHLAHPHTTDSTQSSAVWPQTGFAREGASLALDSRLHAIAIASASNAPSPWASQEYLDGLRAGARWAAIGEGDRALDRHVVSPVGQPRTYAQLGTLLPSGTSGVDLAWRNAVLAGRCFATTGPVLHTLTANGLGMGSTVSLAGPASVSVHIGFRSRGRMQQLTLHGATGPHLQWNWPLGRANVDTTITLVLAHDDFVVADIAGDGTDWPELEFAPRAVSSAIWIDTGAPWPVPPETPRRAVADLERFWSDIFDDRYFETPADSLAAATDILGAADLYEAMVDDAAPPFQLVRPDDGAQIELDLFMLAWEKVVSFDSESVLYRVEIATDPGFASIVWSADLADTTVSISSLPRGLDYHWRVFAMETGDAPVIATNAPATFTLSETAVAAPADNGVFALRSLGIDRVHEGLNLEIQLPAAGPVQLRVFDLRGRLVAVLDRPWLPAGLSPLSWDGRDRSGVPVARGAYRVRATWRGQHADTRGLMLD
jgi:FlgD Ig-like domain